MMQVVENAEFGPVEVLRLRQRPIPTPAPGEVRIRLKATAINPVDYKLRQGSFGGELPMVLGHDLSGVVDAVGEGVDGFKLGDEVWSYLGGPKSNGSYAEWVCTPAQFVGHKPACLSFAEAAAVPLAGLTAYEAVVCKARVGPGDSVLVTGSSGGVGSTAVQLCRHFGADPVLCTAGSQRSLDYLLNVLGIPEHHVIRHPRQSLDQLEALVRSRNDGHPVKVAFDFVGHRMKHLCLRAIDFWGSVVSIVEEPGDFDLNIFHGRTSPLFSRSATLHFEFLGARALYGQPDDWEIYREELEKLASLYQDGHLRAPQVTVLGSFSEEHIRQGHAVLEKGDVQGKLVVTFD